MGEEISQTEFSQEDFDLFREKLIRETALLEQWFEQRVFADDEVKVGAEIEAWLVDENYHPNPINQTFLNAIDNDSVLPELAKFNVEINTQPTGLSHGALKIFNQELNNVVTQCNQTAQMLDARFMMIGILPSARCHDLTLKNMSSMQRYKALNDQVLKLRGGKPISLTIDGAESLLTHHGDVMLESAATSMQLHLQVNQSNAHQFYNLSKIISGPIVAASANSPFLFGKNLWDETRIPLFEQSVSVGASDYSRRVTFGIRYAYHSLLECFIANRDRYPILLPCFYEDSDAMISHLRLHNGTIWRWNRPLIGFDESGKPHLRIEHRVIPAGPSVIDMVANAALYYGLLFGMIDDVEQIEQQVPFKQADFNFYHCARHGLQAEITWHNNKLKNVTDVLLEDLLPIAHQGLMKMNVDQSLRDLYLGVIEARLSKKMNGTAWQRAYINKHQCSMEKLTQTYWEKQQSGLAVHEWSV